MENRVRSGGFDPADREVVGGGSRSRNLGLVHGIGGEELRDGLRGPWEDVE